MRTIFFTGYPGFLGSALLPRMLRRSPEAIAVCLVQQKFALLARQRAAALGDRARIAEGDITAPIDVPSREITEIFHLAAIYDLSVPRDVGMRVNVEGTRHVLDFAERCPSLKRLHYISTCYISGRYRGIFREDDVDLGQRFNNFYEETKFLAEVEVRKRTGLPVTIYRPAVVVGDSATGETQKFDGPYYVLQWLLRQPRIAFLPVVGRPSRYRFNVVPRDFIIEAIDFLSARAESVGKCYALADPAPLTVDETIDTIAEAAGRTVIRIPLLKAVAKFAISHVPGVYRLMRIPPTAVDYFVHPTLYDTENAQRDLASSGIKVPRLPEYAPRLVEFARTHPEIGSMPMA